MAESTDVTKPWLEADQQSFWVISGQVRDNHTFTHCLAVALPHAVTGGHVLFKMLPPLEDLVAPDMISAGRELFMVYADDPGRPYFEEDRRFLAAAAAGDETP